MNFPYRIETTSNRHASLERRLLSNFTKLNGSLKSGPQTFDFSKLNTILEAFENENNKLIAAQESSEDSFFNTRCGKVVHVVMDVGCIFVGLGAGGLGLYVKFFHPEVDSTLFGSTMAASLGLISKGGKDLWKNYNDYEATIIAKQHPMDPKKVNSLKSLAEHIYHIVHLTGPEAQAAFEEYQKIYPSLPVRVKKLLPDPAHWDASLAQKISNQMEAYLGIAKSDPSVPPVGDDEVDGDHELPDDDVGENKEIRLTLPEHKGEINNGEKRDDVDSDETDTSS